MGGACRIQLFEIRTLCVSERPIAIKENCPRFSDLENRLGVTNIEFAGNVFLIVASPRIEDCYGIP